MDREEFSKALKEDMESFGAAITDDREEKLFLYMTRVLELNKSINLTAIREPGDFVRLNLLDSASCFLLQSYREAKTVIDIGTGAGLPGAVLAILSPEKEFTLLDSLAKRMKVLSDIITELGLTNVKLARGRAEDLGHEEEHRERYDLAVSRAVASLPVLSEYALPFVRVGGAFISYKGDKAGEEAESARRALKILGAEEPDILYAGVAGTEHSLIVIKKASKMPEKYPRKAGVPSRKPL